MRSDETWDGNPQFGTPQEMLARDEWILLQLNQYGAPTFHITVSLLKSTSKNMTHNLCYNLYVLFITHYFSLQIARWIQLVTFLSPPTHHIYHWM